MKSIRDIYVIGNGPSSSHTMGPAFAVEHILNKYKKVKFVKGDTAYTLLKKSKLSIKKTGFGKFVYVTTINGLREKQYGPASGWTYRVNGKLPNVSSAVYKLKAKDHLEWRYVNYN
jgi:hypothetical protein